MSKVYMALKGDVPLVWFYTRGQIFPFPPVSYEAEQGCLSQGLSPAQWGLCCVCLVTPQCSAGQLLFLELWVCSWDYEPATLHKLNWGLPGLFPQVILLCDSGGTSCCLCQTSSCIQGSLQVWNKCAPCSGKLPLSAVGTNLPVYSELISTSHVHPSKVLKVFCTQVCVDTCFVSFTVCFVCMALSFVKGISETWNLWGQEKKQVFCQFCSTLGHLQKWGAFPLVLQPKVILLRQMLASPSST